MDFDLDNMQVKVKVFIGVLLGICVTCVVIWWYIDKGIPKPTKKDDYEYIHKILLDNLDKTIKIFNKHNIPYWVMSGTLLGAIREGKIIDYDDDIDLGLFKEDFLKLQNNENNIQNDLSSVGLHLLISGAELLHNKIVSKRLDNNYDVNKIFIDIMSFEKHGDKYILDPKLYASSPGVIAFWGDEWFYEGELLPLSTHKLSNLTVTIPSNPVTYLERMYGDWKTPITQHNHIDEINLQID